MTDQPEQVGGGRRMFGDFAPKLAALTDDLLIEAITHVTLYAGWPKGMGAMGVAKKVFSE